MLLEALGRLLFIADVVAGRAGFILARRMDNYTPDSPRRLAGAAMILKYGREVSIDMPSRADIAIAITPPAS